MTQRLRWPGLLMVGAAGRNVGKTRLAETLVRRASGRGPVIGVKVTTIHETGHRCPRGGDGCGVCSSVNGSWDLREETDPTGNKDTQRLLRAGATRVVWLCVHKAHLAEGARALFDDLPRGVPVVCESNTLRTVVEPDLFLMVRDVGEASIKESAAAVLEHADRIVHSRDRGRHLDFDDEDVGLPEGCWTCRLDAEALVLAGGDSRRMGRDKALVEVLGRRLIEHVLEQLDPWFETIRISVAAGRESAYQDFGRPLLVDRVPDRGPLEGIAMGLAASERERCFVAGCDILRPDMALVRRLLRDSVDADLAVPRYPDGAFAAVHAVYKRSSLPAVEAALGDGRFKVIDIYDQLRTRVIPLESGREIPDLDTPEDLRTLSPGGSS